MNVLEKILEEIDKKADYYECEEQGREHIRMVDMVEVEEIIRSHMNDAENDGWIPVDERLPEVPEGTEDAYCPEFNVTIKDASKVTTLKYAPDGTWFDDLGEVYNVMAWQPLPEPYKPEEDKP